MSNDKKTVDAFDEVARARPNPGDLTITALPWKDDDPKYSMTIVTNSGAGTACCRIDQTEVTVQTYTAAVLTEILAKLDTNKA